MEEELITAIKTPITLMILFTVLSTVFIGIQAVRGSFGEYVTSVDLAVVNGYDAELQSLESYRQSLPATVVYSTLLKNEKIISSISGSATNRNGTTINVTSINSLSNLFDSKVKVSLSKDTEGMYKVVIKGE